MIVSLDFDNTLVWTSKFPVFDPTPLPGCLETLDWLKNKLGAKFILLTQRDDYHTYNPVLKKAVRMSKNDTRRSVLGDAVKWCEDHGIELYGINENPSQGSWSLSRKVYSDIIIDDRCFGIPLTSDGNVDWIEVGRLFKEKYGKDY